MKYSYISKEPAPDPFEHGELSPISPLDYQKIAEEVLGPIDWEDSTTGYCKCPGEHLHTKPTGPKDCKVSVGDGRPPTIYCFHDSCKAEVAQANERLRSKLGKAEARNSGTYNSRMTSQNANKTRIEIKDPLIDCLNYCFKDEDIVSHEPIIMRNHTNLGIVGGGENQLTRKELVAKIKEDKSQVIDPKAFGYYVRINPVTKHSKGRDKDVTNYRYTLIESDEGDTKEQEDILRDSGLPIAALIHSGGKSIHAWVRVDAVNQEQYHERREKIWAALPNTFKIDQKNKNPGRFSRLPGVLRRSEDGQVIGEQKLLALGIGPENYDEWEIIENEKLNQKVIQKVLDDHKGPEVEAPLEVFPEDIQKFIRAVSNYSHVPVGTVMTYVLGVTSIALGKGLIFKDFRGRETSGNIYTLAVIDSGKGKTTTWKQVERPLRQAELEMVEKWEKHDCPEAKALKGALELQKQAKLEAIKRIEKKAKKSDQEEAELDVYLAALKTIERQLVKVENQLTEPVIYKSDVTQPAAECILLKNGSHLAIAGGENRAAIAHIMDENTEQNWMLHSFDGEDMKPHRQTDQSRNQPIRDPIAQLVLSVQSDMAMKLYSDVRSNDNGTIGRFRVIQEIFPYPTTPGKCIPDELHKKWGELFRRIFERYRFGNQSACFISADEEVMKPLDEEYSRINSELNAGKYSALRPQCSRRVEYMRKDCLLLQALHHGELAHETPLTPEIVESAIKLDRFYFSQVLQFAQDNQKSKLEKDEQKVFNFLQQCPDKASRSQISRKIRETTSVTKSIMDRLIEKELVGYEKVIPKRGGTPSHLYWLRREGEDY